jgi:hypothetical protein
MHRIFRRPIREALKNRFIGEDFEKSKVTLKTRVIEIEFTRKKK